MRNRGPIRQLDKYPKMSLPSQQTANHGFGPKTNLSKLQRKSEICIGIGLIVANPNSAKGGDFLLMSKDGDFSFTNAKGEEQGGTKKKIISGTYSNYSNISISPNGNVYSISSCFGKSISFFRMDNDAHVASQSLEKEP